MQRFLAFLLCIAPLASGCGPSRGFGDSAMEDVPRVDTQTHSDAADATLDATVEAASEAGNEAGEAAAPCNRPACDDSCTDAGAIVGRCQVDDGGGAERCVCVGGPDAGPDVPNDVRGDQSTAPDVVYESSVRGCMSNENCPPTLYCNGTSCTGEGFCGLRGESDPLACGTDGPASCGCDGTLYPNVCLRQLTGVRQDPMNRCPRPDASHD